ncbi:glyoxalase [bacterium CG17_big_fil_post_rev_8_21_14_2_50_64_8]|nr:MAG: glyoxalase [bacterium CG17_big_fil_post_rev_8_21_14_2_50_64_8]PJA73441.1 MAG: glyoxalase [bacterium CG_4_9_14_3_um_filter_65_15]
MESFLEHVNITVGDPQATAELLCRIFGWKIRWSGPAIHDGLTYHVGGENSYIAVYSLGGSGAAGNSYATLGGLNHVGVVVEDLDAVEAKVKATGLTPHSHADYDPGRRFYFDDPDGIEYEVASYS